jgi:hypothetical protein
LAHEAFFVDNTIKVASSSLLSPRALQNNRGNQLSTPPTKPRDRSTSACHALQTPPMTSLPARLTPLSRHSPLNTATQLTRSPLPRQSSSSASSSSTTSQSKAAPAPQSPPTAALPPLARYLDYTRKYGIGYVMSDGTVGALFNDATRIAVRGVCVRYWNVARDMTTFRLLSHPPEMTKKVCNGLNEC